jgi:hypothetical protein
VCGRRLSARLPSYPDYQKTYQYKTGSHLFEVSKTFLGDCGGFTA